MSRKKITVGVAVGMVTVLVGAALAFSDIHFTAGTVSSYDFGSFGGVAPGFVVVEGFTMKPGDTVGWHYHKGQSYVIVTRGTVTEEDVVENQCSTQQDNAGTAFVEPPGRVHNVTNNGPGVAVIWWATVFPQSDGIQSDGTYYVDPPNCN